MHDLSREEVVTQLVNLLQSELTHTRSVRVPHIGTFRIIHHTSEIRDEEGGGLCITPPKDELHLQSEIDLADEDK